MDRQPGKGGLQVHDDMDGWQDAPYVSGAITLNIGDLMACWTTDRWRAPDTTITSLPAPVGRTSYPPVRVGDYLRDKMQAIYTTG